VKFRGQVCNIEVTSTHGGQLLGKEYKEISGPTLDPVENWIERANSIPNIWMTRSAGSKKKYASPCWLVVYLNISEYGIRQSETKQIIAETKALGRVRQNFDLMEGRALLRHSSRLLSLKEKRLDRALSRYHSSPPPPSWSTWRSTV
jgi:hypothetical protein